LIDQWAYSSPLACRHPLEKGVLAFLVLAACLVAKSWWVPALAFGLMSALVLGAVRTPWRVYLRLLLVPAAFLAAGLPAMALSVLATSPCEGQWVAVGGFYAGIAPQGLILARDVLCRTMGAVSALCFFALSTPMCDLISFLRRCRVPVLFLDLLALIYRFVFVLLETGLAMQRAQALRLGYCTPSAGLRSAGCLLANLFVRAQHRALGLYVALSTRGYEGRLDVLERPCCLSARNMALSAGTGGLLLVLAVVTAGVGQ